jgi:glycosyltransferase involved in cell wall biosynthesis
MKRALIVASGLRGIIGHNYFYTQTVKRELEQRGFEVTVFANKHAPKDFVKETGFKPVFSIGTYDFIPFNSPFEDSVFLYLQSGIYSYELKSAMNSCDGANFDFVFCHTVADFELISWNRFLKRNKFNGHLFVMKRNTPRFGTIPKWKKLFHPFHRLRPHYLNALHRRLKKRFTLLTDSRLLTEDYAKIYSHRIVTAPIPLEDSFSHDDSKTTPSADSVVSRYGLKKDGFIDFGYLGDSREGKGFSMLPEVIEKLAATENPKLRFIIQCPLSEYEKAVVPEGLAELNEAAKKVGERLVIINEGLSDADYMELFRFMDVVLIPYTGAGAVEGTSNIYTEAAALGKPVVVSDNTWMAGELKRYGGGLEFAKGSSVDLIAKITELAENYENFAKLAVDFSSIWKETHNAKELVDLLLRESGS